MYFFFVVIPAATVVIAFVFGYCISALRFVLSLMLYAALLAVCVYVFDPPTILWALAFALFVFGIPLIAALSIKKEKVIDPSLADHAKRAAHAGYVVYEELDEDKKEKLHRGAKLAAKLGLRYASAKLMQHGKQPEASLLRNSAKLL